MLGIPPTAAGKRLCRQCLFGTPAADVRAASGFCLRTVPLRGACGIVVLGIVPRNTTRARKASLKQFPRSDEKRGFRHRLTPADEETEAPLSGPSFFPFISRPQGKSGEGREVKGKKQTQQRNTRASLSKGGRGVGFADQCFPGEEPQESAKKSSPGRRSAESIRKVTTFPRAEKARRAAA